MQSAIKKPAFTAGFNNFFNSRFWYLHQDYWMIGFLRIWLVVLRYWIKKQKLTDIRFYDFLLDLDSGSFQWILDISINVC